FSAPLVVKVVKLPILLMRSWLFALRKAFWSSRVFNLELAVAFSSKQSLSLTVAEFKRSCVSLCLASSSAYFFCDTHEDKRTVIASVPRKTFFIVQIII